jgi:hypothetical protein
MTPDQFVQKTLEASKREHQSRKTRDSYVGWARRFAVWLKAHKNLHAETSEIKVSSYLSHLTNRPGGCSPRTQHQAV